MTEIADTPSPDVPGGAAGTGLDLRSLGQLLYMGAIGFGGLALLLWVLAQWNEGGAGEAVDAVTGTITLSLFGEPPQLDSTRGTDAVSFNILGHTMEGLLRYDADNRLVGASPNAGRSTTPRRRSGYAPRPVGATGSRSLRTTSCSPGARCSIR